MSVTADPASVPGLPESGLSAADLAALPAGGPPAPWTCRARALTWIQRAPTPPHLPGYEWFGRPLPLCVVCFVEYLDTPVGPYREVLAAAVVRRGAAVAGQIPFIAVDSLASVRGGRVNWALPKTMARFEGDLGEARMAATGDGWSLSAGPSSSRVQPLATGRPRSGFPLRLAFSAVGPLGRYRTSLRSGNRLVRVRVDVTGPTIGPWLGGGTRFAVLSEGRMQIGAPSRAPSSAPPGVQSERPPQES